ncbi:P-type phospholipid transporter [Malassezia yamatoensis]|uniref:Phospholipid-transporting ATPase n=1 Tax=Malassezia yamatoensis TaxID=253288 RepID=A0AAJ5YUW2_9BASI|nr:P-type phospholipid transporter [Malassezia yamatoensis]
MDDIESLFSSRPTPRQGAGRPSVDDQQGGTSHVLFGQDDFDLLGDENPVQPTRMTTEQSYEPSLDRAESSAGMRKGDLDDEDEQFEFGYEDDMQLRPMGSSKMIEADDDADAEFLVSSPSARPNTSRRSRGSAPKKHLKRKQQSSSALAASKPSILSMLFQDFHWQLRGLHQRIRQRVLIFRGQYTRNTSRQILLNDAEANARDLEFCSNQVMTNKYNVLSFLPLFLAEQFSKYANVFFLFIGCLQQIPGVSPTNRWTTLVPLGIVLLASAVKEILEDWQRYKADAELNASTIPVLDSDSGSWQPRAWRDVCVGDIVRVERDGFFPADLLLLSSSEPDGLAYVETANLDGETNLKVKQALPATSKYITPAAISGLHGKVKCELPNNSLYTFDGTLRLPNSTQSPLGPDQLLLRGSQLRNAPWIFGLVVFTGHDTKLLQNSTKSPVKRTRVEKQVNTLILSLFVLMLALAIVCSIGASIASSSAKRHALYLMPELDDRSGARAFVESVLTFIILYNSLIPISLIVTMDLVKYQQATLINSDLDMYFAKTDTPAQCRRSNLVEDLGQIDYIFSDKTGTLTRNEMEFKQATVGGVCFADTAGEAQVDDEYEQDRLVAGRRSWSQLPEILHKDLDKLRLPMDEFLTILAVCHTVIPERQGNKIVLQASSPDEAALVAGAERLGYRFVTRKPRSVYVEVGSDTLEYEVLQVCEFNSTRKRMSTVVRRPDGRITVLCKGADTVILPRLAANQAIDTTLAQLENYAAEGLRTLCIAKREIDYETYRAWAEKYEVAAASLQNRAAQLDAVAEELEQHLTLVGATAIEDKLQEGVPETIATLQNAGIKIWVLTGDRQETAINIGYSCRLISESMSLLIVNEGSAEETTNAIHQQLETVHEQLAEAGGMQEDLALVIEGRSLQHALHSDVAPLFLELASVCKAVICCRVSPLQKALVVEMVKAYTTSILLAIGDGANDVGMIQAAHVGIGISGLEGLQAARTADVSISQFRYLQKLLLVHGNWSYARLSKMILYSFYKTVTLYLTLFWFSFYNRFSGQTAYESWSQSFYNVIFTVLPTLVIGIFDQYVSARMLERYPQLYRQAFFTNRDIGGWMLNAVYHSILNFFLVVYAFYDAVSNSSGYNNYQWLIGTTLFFTVLVTVLGKAALIMNLWTRYTVMAIPGSLALTLAFFVVFGTIAPALGVAQEYSFIVPRLLGLPLFWILLIFVPITSLLRDLIWRFWQRTYSPQSYHIVQEMQKYNLQDIHPHADQFQQNIRKVRAAQRKRRSRGYAFSQTEGDQAHLIRQYDTTKDRPLGL